MSEKKQAEPSTRSDVEKQGLLSSSDTETAPVRLSLTSTLRSALRSQTTRASSDAVPRTSNGSSKQVTFDVLPETQPIKERKKQEWKDPRPCTPFQAGLMVLGGLSIFSLVVFFVWEKPWTIHTEYESSMRIQGLYAICHSPYTYWYGYAWSKRCLCMFVLARRAATLLVAKPRRVAT
jgi:hypothetical protein